MSARELNRLAVAARRAIRAGRIDPLVALSYVVWPTSDIREAAKRQ